MLINPNTDPVAAQQKVDYRFAPARWFTPICLVDDWQKSLVDESGRLAYDFGPGPYAKPKTTVTVEVAGADGSARTQTLLHPRVPLVITEHADGARRWRQTAFALIPERISTPSNMAPDSSFVRFEGLVGSPAWTPAHAGRDPAFRSVAWGTGRSIRYSVRVPRGGARRVALGFLEVYRKGRILRLMSLRVEGAAVQEIDLIKTAGNGVPHIVFFDARDADGDGWLKIEVTGSARTQDPNVFVNGIWLFRPNQRVTAEDIISGTAAGSADTYIDAGRELIDAGLVRQDMLRSELLSRDGALIVRVNTLRQLTPDTAAGVLLFDGAPFLATRPAFNAAKRTESGFVLRFAEDTRRVDVVVQHGHSKVPFTFPDAAEETRRAVQYWQQAQLPWDRLYVPDPDIQDLLDGGIRTLYQVREVVDGLPQFQPGATVYRGLWYGDGNYGVETAALLDDTAAARGAIDGMLRHRTPAGRFGVMKPALLHRETAHLMWGIGRYARLHEDWSWLSKRWPLFQKAMLFLVDLRKQASADPAAPWHGLFPPGLTDGGVGGVGASYGSVYWGLIAMAEAVRTAAAMRRPEAATWQAEFDDFMQAFERAALRDRRQDEHGNYFLPVKMDFNPEKDVPQRGQWGPIQSVYAGQFITEDHWLVKGSLAMLEARTVQNHVVSLGWLTGGLWPIFEAHRALAYNWLGHSAKAETLLYAFANHATPTLLWAEEQFPKGKGTRTAGDTLHTVGNMQIVRLVRHLLLLERGPDLEALPGLPVSWLKPGARLSALALPTHFGPATIKLQIDTDGKRGTLWVETPAPDAPAGVVRLKLKSLRAAGFEKDATGEQLPLELVVPWGQLYRLDFGGR